MPTLTGGCLCGGVRFEVEGPFIRAGHCHCSRCRRHSGTAVCTQARVRREHFRLCSGAELIRAYRGGEQYAVKAFCSVCGSSLFGGSWPDGPQISIRLGAFDGDPGIRPEFHTYVDSRACWDEISDDLPQYPAAWSRDATPHPGTPTLVAHFRQMAANNRWSNARLHAACAALPMDEYFRDRGAFFGSIHATVSHIVTIDEWYLAGLHGERAGRVDYATIAHATLDGLTRAQEASDRRLLAHCEALTPARLGEVARWGDEDGDAHAEPVHLVLAHLFLHQIHHRGQVHDLMLQAGIAPPQLDEFFLRADAARRADELRRLGLDDAAPVDDASGEARRMSEVTIVAERARGADASALTDALDRDLLARYPHTSIHGIDPVEIEATGVFVIARLDGRAVGCGALRPLAPGIAEVKRMFVHDGARRRGIARRILGALEAAARERDVVVLRLETGTRQPESIALYESAGYVRIPCFGEYVTDPYSVCYEKRVAACDVPDR